MAKVSRIPRVSIGMPVYNGENFVREAIVSILMQTYSDFELIISDNGSIDATKEICQAYAREDARVSYHRCEENRGASWNYNWVFHNSSGEYFKWAAHDDVLAPELLANCVRVLDADPDVVLAFSWLEDIDELGNRLGRRQSTVHSNLPQPHQRFRSLSELRPSYTCEEVFGLIRSCVLKKTKLIADYPDSDRTLLAELGLYGPFQEIPEVLFLHRIHSESSVAVRPTRQERAVWFNPETEGRIVFPSWRQFAELTSVIFRSPISLEERVHCCLHMIRWLKRSRNRLGNDLVWALKHSLLTASQIIRST